MLKTQLYFFSYRFVDLGDSYGYVDDNGTWHGAIRRLIDGVSEAQFNMDVLIASH